MTRSPLFVPLILLVLVTLAGPSQAAQSQAGGSSGSVLAPAGDPSPLVGSLRKSLHDYVSADADQDGVVTDAEAEVYFGARFAVMDADRDGRLSGPEFVRLGAIKRRGAAVPGLRTGRFSKFEQLDLDGDGSVSPEEFAFDIRSRRAATAAWNEKEKRRREAIFSRLDADGAGFVDKSRYIAAGTGWFESIDRDGDGAVPVWRFLSEQRL